MRRNDEPLRAVPFDGSIERVGETLAVIAPRGELDAFSYEGFRAELAACGAGDVVVDLTDVTFVDSTTLDAVVQASEQAGARGDALTVVCSDRHTRKLLEATGSGYGRSLRLERSLSEAVAHSLAR
jgi:anti-sigma B factor antagonist